jgi:Flp pilus assembly protein TadG
MKNISRRIARIFTRQEGQQLVLMCMLLPVLLAGMGLVIDMGATYQHLRVAQAAADAGATAAAAALNSGKTMAQAITIAREYAQQNGFHTAAVQVYNPPISGAYRDANHLQVVVTDQVRPVYISFVWRGTFTTAGRATTGATPNPAADSSFIVLDRTAAHSLYITGGATLRVTQGNFYVNSNAADALKLDNGAHISSQQPGKVVGGISIAAGSGYLAGSATAISNLPTPPTPALVPLDDPYKDIPQPNPSDTVSYPIRNGGSPYVIDNAHTGTIQPGTYVGGVSVQGGATLTLQPGVYIFKNGNFSIGNDAHVTGNGVLLFFTGSSNGTPSHLDVTGGVSPVFTPIQNGSLAGITVWQDRATAPTINWGNGIALVNVTGVIYMPSANLNVMGGANVMQANLIVNTLNMSNGCSMTISGYRGAGWPTTAKAALLE